MAAVDVCRGDKHQLTLRAHVLVDSRLVAVIVCYDKTVFVLFVVLLLVGVRDKNIGKCLMKSNKRRLMGAETREVER